MNEWRISLSDFLAHAWVQLVAGAAARNTVALATVSPSGWPEVRTVVLRAADADRGTVVVYTDSTSDKMASLARSPCAALVLWDKKKQLQVRLQGYFSVRTGAEVAHLWQALPAQSLLSYGVNPAPGKVIAGPEDYVKTSDPTAFAVLTMTVAHMDVVQLDLPHRRAGFSREGDWAGNWLAP